MSPPPLGQHFFRHEYGRLVAMLSRRVGMRHLETVEDAVQSALLTALESWARGPLPENPSAWLFRAAHNHVIGELRQRSRRDRLIAQHGLGEADATATGPTAALAGDVRDDLLRMLFVCCDDSIPSESQLAIALKTLCGFDVHEIAERLFTTEANVYKRLGRARSRLRELPFEPDDLSAEQLASRLPAVQSILYLLFTEGYLSSHAEEAIRRELCDEAKRLAEILAEHPVGGKPETFALLALIALARRAHACQAGWLRWSIAARRAGPRPLGPARDSDGPRVAGQVGSRGRLLPVPRGGGHCRRALPCTFVRGDAVGPNRGMLCVARAAGALRASHAESSGRSGGVARGGRGARNTRGA